MRSKLMMAFAIVVALGFTAPADAAAVVKVGVLTCNVASGWGFVFGSSKDIHCTYAPIKGTPEHYSGTIKKFGVDIGYTQGGIMVWGVFAPTLNPGSLAGEYVGATASASAVVGVGANVLVGGFKKSVTLQPVSIDGNTGLNLAAGIGALHLTFAY